MTRRPWPTPSPRLHMSFKIGHPIRCAGPSASVAALGMAGKKSEVDKNEKPSFAINLKPGPFVTSRTNTMASRRESKPSVKAKERAEPHFGSRKRDDPRKPRKSQARKSPDRPSLRANSSGSDRLAGMKRQVRDRRSVAQPACQVEPVTPLVMWTVYKHPNDYPADYVARKFVITEDFYRSSDSISSRSLRDVRNLVRSLYPGLIQLKRPPDDEPHIVEVWL
jgi:hypothetical protein